MTTEIHARGACVGWRVFVFVAFADQVIHEDDALAALILRQHLPIGAVHAGVSAARGPPREGEILEMGDEVVLAAGRTTRDGEMSGCLVLVLVDLLSGKPQLSVCPIARERHNSPADPAHESMNHRSQ